MLRLSPLENNSMWILIQPSALHLDVELQVFIHDVNVVKNESQWREQVYDAHC